MNSVNEQLRAIDKELADLESRKQVLIERKASLEKTRQSQNPSNTNKISDEERISIFTELFKGRSDVFALKWENPKSGKSGYSPACHNEWKQGICNKPYTKCTDCKNQNFKKLNQQEIYKHLTWMFHMLSKSHNPVAVPIYGYSSAKMCQQSSLVVLVSCS